MDMKLPDEPYHSTNAHTSVPATLLRCRVTALLDCGATVDGGIHLAHSVPQIINQARQRLSAPVLGQVVRWQLELASAN
jgi:hypothetical protein